MPNLLSQTNQYPLQQLNDEEKNNPILAIDSFFADYHLKEVKQEIHHLQQVAIFTDNETYTSGRDRTNLVYFCEKLEALAEAAYLLKEKENLFQQFLQQHHEIPS